jgi:quercetin dioxygenase-like cupin family protein
MRPHDVMPPSTLDPGRLAEQVARLAGEIQATGRSPGGPLERRSSIGAAPPSPAMTGCGDGAHRGYLTGALGAWQVPLLLADDVEVWLLGWPAGQVTPAHDHGGSAVALTVVEGALTEECLDPTIWTTGRRTTWGAGQTTAFPPDHVHVLGAAGDRPAVAVHAWSPRRWERPSAGDGAALLRRGGGLGGGRLGGAGAAAAAAGSAARLAGGRARQAQHRADGALDARHVGDRVPG